MNSNVENALYDAFPEIFQPEDYEDGESEGIAVEIFRQIHTRSKKGSEKMKNTELTQIRESLSLTKAQLAEKLGIKPMLLGRYEKGSCGIPEKIAEAVKKLSGTADSFEKAVAAMPQKIDETELPSMEDLSTFLKDLRSTLNLSRAEFARQIGVSTASVGFYETGRTRPKSATIEKIKELAEKTAPSVDEKSSAQADEEKLEEVPVEEAAPVEEAVPVDEEKQTAIIIQSLMGGSITPEEILSRIPEGCDSVYVKPEENKAYWTKGSEAGSIDLW